MQTFKRSRRSVRMAVYCLVFIFCIAVAGAIFANMPHRPLRTYSFLTSKVQTSEWQEFGGVWDLRPDSLHNLSGGRGDKMVVGNRHWSDYSVDTDLRFDTDPGGMHWGDSGVILRVTEPQIGVDAYRGYYVGLSYEDNILFIGKADYGWIRLATVPLSAPVRVGEWYHLRARAAGCYIQAEVYRTGSSQVDKTSLFDEGCVHTAGAVGVRTFGVRASWKNILIAPARSH